MSWTMASLWNDHLSYELDNIYFQMELGRYVQQTQVYDILGTLLPTSDLLFLLQTTQYAWVLTVDLRAKDTEDGLAKRFLFSLFSEEKFVAEDFGRFFPWSRARCVIGFSVIGASTYTAYNESFFTFYPEFFLKYFRKLLTTHRLPFGFVLLQHDIQLWYSDLCSGIINLKSIFYMNKFWNMLKHYSFRIFKIINTLCL